MQQKEVFLTTSILIAACGGNSDLKGMESMPVPNALYELLDDCEQLSGTKRFAKKRGQPNDVPLCKLSHAIWWQADMAIDCDGGLSEVCKTDPYYQAETAAVDSKGNPLNASTLPFVVIPLPSLGFDYKAFELKLGSVVAVVYQGRLTYGIIGDVGPRGVIGEASYAMAEILGINPHPVYGGVNDGVTYIAFTGASAVLKKKEDAAEAQNIGRARMDELLGTRRSHQKIAPDAVLEAK